MDSAFGAFSRLVASLSALDAAAGGSRELSGALPAEDLRPAEAVAACWPMVAAGPVLAPGAVEGEVDERAAGCQWRSVTGSGRPRILPTCGEEEGVQIQTRSGDTA